MRRSSGSFPGWVRYAVGGVVGLVLVWIALVVIVPHACGSFLSTAKATSTGECVGVVNRVDSLDPAIQNVARKILDENATVGSSSGPYVRIVLLTPLGVSKVSASAISLDQIRFSLEGAFTALYRVNHTTEFGDPAAVKIQMPLVNQGSRQDYSDQLVNEIMDQGNADHPVVAVVGLGSSFTGTEATARALSARNIPMVTAVASANSLDAHDIKTLHSVSPSNTDYVQALKDLLDQHQAALPLNSAIVVGDVNDDPYVRTLNQVYATTLVKYVQFPTLPFRGGTVGHPATPDVFDPVVTNLCNAANDRAGLNTVLFAGRVADFKAFAQVLADRTCRDTPLAVLVGATGFGAARQYVDIVDRGKITVIYSSSSDAPAWIGGREGTPEGFKAFLDRFRERGFADASLDDGYAIGYHDAMVSAARATRVAAQGSTIPSPADVDVQFGNLTRAYTVRAASGTLSFGLRADGRATGKLVVYRQIGTNTPFHLPADLAPHLM